MWCCLKNALCAQAYFITCVFGFARDCIAFRGMQIVRKILRISRRFLRAYFMYIKKINGETHKGSRQPAQRDDYEISPCLYYLFLETATLFSVTVQICFIVRYAIERVRMKHDTRLGRITPYIRLFFEIRRHYRKNAPRLRQNPARNPYTGFM